MRRARQRRRRGGRAVLCTALAALVLHVAATPARAADPRFWEVVSLQGFALGSLLRQPIDSLGALRCDRSHCVPIPFQVDERNAAGQWVLPHGAEPNPTDGDGRLDRNDTLLFMAADAGAADSPAKPLEAAHLIAVDLRDPLGFETRRVYLGSFASSPPRSTMSYVSYDAAADRIRGADVSLGFSGAVPQHLSFDHSANLLDRLKVRARASLLWGLLRFGRDEGDLDSGPVTWRAGPIRVIRRQQHSIRIGFGIRSPRFGSYTYFYRDYADLPVSVRLRVPPRYFFSDISVRAVLDFRGLPGRWDLLVPGASRPIPVDCRQPPPQSSPDGISSEWFALRGPRFTLVQRLRRSPSLSSVREHLWYRSSPDFADPPESVPGVCPGVGFVLDHWEGVEGGYHMLESASYALPQGVEIGTFLATADSPLQPNIRVIR